MSDTYDPVEHIRASQPANDALMAHWKSHPEYDPERGLVFTGPSLPPESFERMVTLTISREDAEGIVSDLPAASADFVFGRIALACRAALEGGEVNTTQGENMDLSTITTDNLLAEVARRVKGQTKPESENWPVVNGYEIKPGANLGGANLGGADLMYADLRYADLRGAYLWGAYLWGANLWGARVNNSTTIDLPSGWKIEDGLIVYSKPLAPNQETQVP